MKIEIDFYVRRSECGEYFNFVLEETNLDFEENWPKDGPYSEYTIVPITKNIAIKLGFDLEGGDYQKIEK